MSKGTKLDKKFVKWKGIPRKKIVWYPTINDDKCRGCGMCITSCGRKVFDYDRKRKKTVVSRPLNCMVGCTSCQVWCIYDAISFPDPQYVKQLIKEKKILKNVRKDLEELIDNDNFI